MDYGIQMPAGTSDAIIRFQSVHASNLAGTSSPGFKAEIPYTKQLKQSQNEAMVKPRFNTRHLPEPGRSQTNFSSGPLRNTSRDLDVAVSGKGWLVVEVNGTEMLTRNGQLDIGANGTLMTSSGYPVMGQGGGAIDLPEFSSITIGRDGSISLVPRGGQGSEIVEADRIMLVNPDESDLQRQTGSMFRYAGDAPLAVDANVELLSGVLEASNVDGVAELMSFMALGREFEMNVKMMTAFGDMSSSGDKLIQLNVT
ncbi:flagellar basal body rod protein FlgF [Sansalvadorimonas sp. 2012CJ34-2]|uniref:Flagellar basal-body rod protein FlgF n=1 Tax=Parendozoicomonas callyspongiae TaxID=2942213 RepID=A0ABT0PDV2_9GAMM|nr:flagellar basal body rod protein FlgF [Sansalvadorimonas sp. 2012CJ34-2]MCL6269552.1 flagellar basal body rod protein FlgF [Sansalvadorimonas sp. 2012CJ34-2]